MASPFEPAGNSAMTEHEMALRNAFLVIAKRPAPGQTKTRLSPPLLREQASDLADVVLGPCEDGGYYLIGLKRPQTRLLREVQMSTPHVLGDTLALAQRDGLRVALLPSWYDVDTVQKLERLRADRAAEDNGAAPYSRAFLSRLAPDSQRAITP